MLALAKRNSAPLRPRLRRGLRPLHSFRLSPQSQSAALRGPRRGRHPPQRGVSAMPSPGAPTARWRGWAAHTCTQRATQGPTPRFAGWEMYGPPDPWESHKVPYNAKHGVMHLTGVGRGRFPVPAAPTAADGAPPKHLGTGRRYRAGCHFALRPLWW